MTDLVKGGDVRVVVRASRLVSWIELDFEWVIANF
jgi:hypothetical protein